MIIITVRRASARQQQKGYKDCAVRTVEASTTILLGNSTPLVFSVYTLIPTFLIITEQVTAQEM